MFDPNMIHSMDESNRQDERMETCTDAELLAASEELIAQNREAYEVLAK